MNKNRLCGIAAAVAATLGASTALSADTYPARPLRLVVPFPPGGGTDIMGRMVAAHLGEAFGVQAVVDNRGGAAGIIGSELAAKSNPDGYTLLIGSVSTISINPSLHKKLPLDPVNDLAPISLIAVAPSLLVVSASQPVKNVRELIAAAKARPGEMSFGSAGSGTSHHLGGELFKLSAGIDIFHVPYKGTAPAVTDLVANQVTMMIANTPAVLPMVKVNKLRALAITTLQRSSLMPELPTVAESGLPGFEVIVWYGVLAPRGTPQNVIGRLNAELTKMAKLPETKERLSIQGAEAISSSPEAFGKRIRDDVAKWAKVVKVSGAKAD